MRRPVSDWDAPVCGDPAEDSIDLRLSVTALIVCLLLRSASAVLAAAPSPRPLERFPVCEASAALAMPCSGFAGEGCVWVADNEQADAIFQYVLDDAGTLAPAPVFEVPIAGAPVGDVEALAAAGGGALAVGSHSRSRSCKAKDERVGVTRIVPEREGHALEAAAVAGGEDFDRERCAAMFAIPRDAAAEPLRDRFCATLDAAERAASEVVRDRTLGREQRASACAARAPNTLNVEGALVLPAADGERLWLGLRGPVVDGYAVLLRVTPFGAPGAALRFDGIAFARLGGGHGIRELARAGDEVWGIAGCVPDCPSGTSRLWHVPASAIESGRVIENVHVLPDVALSPSAEGLLVQPERRRAIVVIDGDRGDDEHACRTAPGQQVIPLP